MARGRGKQRQDGDHAQCLTQRDCNPLPCIGTSCVQSRCGRFQIGGEGGNNKPTPCSDVSFVVVTQCCCVAVLGDCLFPPSPDNPAASKVPSGQQRGRLESSKRATKRSTRQAADKWESHRHSITTYPKSGTQIRDKAGEESNRAMPPTGYDAKSKDGGRVNSRKIGVWCTDNTRFGSAFPRRVIKVSSAIAPPSRGWVTARQTNSPPSGLRYRP